MNACNIVFDNPSLQAMVPNGMYALPADDEAIDRTVRALEKNGMQALVADDAAEVRVFIERLIPAGAEVFTSTSTTLVQLGIAAEIDRAGGRYDSVRVKLAGFDPTTQERAMQKLGATPAFIVGSIHALTETGVALVASMTGSQLAPYAASAARVIWVVGSQKIVPDLEEGLRRINEYALPLEDRRARDAYGVHSGVNKLLVVNREIVPGRITVIIVRQNVGF